MPSVGTSNRIYSVTLKGTYAGANTINVFHYRCNIISQPTALLVAENFRDETLQSIVVPQLTGQAYSAIDVIDHMDVLNFSTLAITETGDRTPVNSLPPFMTWSLQLLRSSRDMRSGWKRFSALDEADVSGTVFSAAFIAFVVSAQAGIIQPLNIDLLSLPLVLVRDRPTPNSPLIDPDDPTTWLYTDVAGSVFPNRPTTQNSRKTF